MLRQCIEWLESGERTAADLVSLCRKRIAEREPELRAWVEMAPPETPHNGPLHGIPFGVKDIYETRTGHRIRIPDLRRPKGADGRRACDAASGLRGSPDGQDANDRLRLLRSVTDAKSS